MSRRSSRAENAAAQSECARGHPPCESATEGEDERACSIEQSWPPAERSAPPRPPPDGQRHPATTAPAPHPVPPIARKTIGDRADSHLQRLVQDRAIPHACHDIAPPDS